MDNKEAREYIKKLYFCLIDHTRALTSAGSFIFFSKTDKDGQVSGEINPRKAGNNKLKQDHEHFYFNNYQIGFF